MFNIAKAEQYRIIAVVGLVGKGKTFLINSLFGTNLLSGELFATRA